MASETSSNSNIQATTRELFLRTIKSQVFMKMPLYARLLLAKKVSWEGGRYISAPVDMAEMDSLTQAYLPAERLTTGRKTMLDTPYFHWKYSQTPSVYDVEEELQNAGGVGTAPVKFVKFLTRKAHRAARLALYKQMYGIGTSGTDADHDADFQSVRDALTHDATYGHLTRATTVTNKWWQGASIGETYADQGDTFTASINTFRRARSAIGVYVEQPADLLCVVGSTIFLNLQSEVEARHIYNRDGSVLAKYGFNTLMLDGVEVVEDPWLRNSLQTNAHKWFFIFNINDWELRIHPRRSFKFTGYTWQGDKADGYDEWLARIMLAGNLVCWKPNGSIYLSAVE